MSGSAMTNLKKYKIVILGDLSVGKTSIINMFIYGTFDSAHQPTIGIDFLSKTMYFDDRTVRLQLWDTAGQERFRSLIPNYIRDCSAALLVYDITQRQSFLNVDQWIEDIRAARGTDVIIMLTGNKADLNDKRAVTLAEGEQKAKDLGVMFTEVSAKTGDNVKTLFKNVTQELPGMQDAPLPNSAEFEENKFRLNEPQSQEPQKKCQC